MDDLSKKKILLVFTAGAFIALIIWVIHNQKEKKTEGLIPINNPEEDPTSRDVDTEQDPLLEAKKSVSKVIASDPQNMARMSYPSPYQKVKHTTDGTGMYSNNK